MTAKQIPDQKTRTKHTIIAILSMILWFWIDDLIGSDDPDILDIFYGQYGGLIFGVICGILASFKNRNPVAWFALGSWGVLLSLMFILFLPKLHLRLCPYCREGVAVDASVCPHCQRNIDFIDLDNPIEAPLRPGL